MVEKDKSTHQIRTFLKVKSIVKIGLFLARFPRAVAAHIKLIYTNELAPPRSRPPKIGISPIDGHS